MAINKDYVKIKEHPYTKQIYDTLRNYGLTPQQTAGIMGNM